MGTVTTAPRQRKRARSNRSEAIQSLDLKATSRTSHQRTPHVSKNNTPESSELIERDRAILEHLHLVKTIASSIRKTIPVHVDFDDLVQAGVMGLVDAANKYNEQKQACFPTYAKHRIRGAVLDSLRQLDWATRDMRRRQKLVSAAMTELSADLQRTPSEAEVADKLGMDLTTCRTTMNDLLCGGPVSSSRFKNDNEDLSAPEFPSGPETRPDYICGREQLHGVLDEIVKTLPERYQKVVVMYYSNEMSMKEIGRTLGINESRVSQIHKVALGKMAAVLGAKGIASRHAFVD